MKIKYLLSNNLYFQGEEICMYLTWNTKLDLKLVVVFWKGGRSTMMVADS